jgi:glutaredoxin-like protein NrdH
MRTIILYTATGCPLCARYRALFDEQGWVFEERNTTEDPAYRDELARLGVMVTPAVVIGDRAVPGFRPNTVTELLAS